MRIQPVDATANGRNTQQSGNSRLSLNQARLRIKHLVSLQIRLRVDLVTLGLAKCLYQFSALFLVAQLLSHFQLEIFSLINPKVSEGEEVQGEKEAGNPAHGHQIAKGGVCRDTNSEPEQKDSNQVKRSQPELELAILSAQRRSDLAKMKYTDIKDGCLNVIQQKNKRTDEIGHKVAIPMELAIKGLSLQATIARTKNVVSRYLIHHSKQAGRAKVGGKIRDMSLAQEFSRLRELVGITGENPPTLHEVRSLSARLYTEKYGKEFANALLGHKSAKMTDLYLDERDGWFRPKIAN